MTRFRWLLGVLVLSGIGLLVACATNFNRSTDGLVVTGSWGSNLLESFFFGLNSGSVTAIGNTPIDTASLTCVLNGAPTAIVLDPAGAYAYAIIQAYTPCNSGTVTSTTGLMSFKVNSDGTLGTGSTQVAFNNENVTNASTGGVEAVPVVPSTIMVMDTAGKYLFVADRATTDSTGLYVPGAISVFAVSSGTITEVSGSPFYTTPTPITSAQPTNDFSAVAITPTVFPTQNAVCSEYPLPTVEYLYAVDARGYQIFEFGVNMSTGALGNPSGATSVLSFPTDQVPNGVTVDPCNRFVYVSDSLTNKISAYTMCNGSTTQSASCTIPTTLPAGSLIPVSGSPFSLTAGANGPGPLVVDAFGNYLYVLELLSNQISILNVSPVTGALVANKIPTVTTGSEPKAIGLRSDDSWLFVSNFNSATLSEYAITPQTGTLSAAPTIQTDNYPWGIAVK